jgi:hypothetical protein
MASEEDMSCRFCEGAIREPVSHCPYCGREIMAICPQCKRYVDIERSQCPDCLVPVATIAEIAAELGRELRIPGPETAPRPQGLWGRLLDQMRTWQPLAPARGSAAPREEPKSPAKENGPNEGAG